MPEDRERIEDEGWSRRGRAPRSPAADRGEPRRNWLRRILGQGPEARRRLAEAVAALLGTSLVAMAAIVGLVLWHLVRRGRLLRDRLDPPKIVRMPDIEDIHHERPPNELPPP